MRASKAALGRPFLWLDPHRSRRIQRHRRAGPRLQVSAVRDEPGLDRSTDPVSIQQAMHTPLMQSSEQVRHMVASQPRQQDMSQHAQSHPSPSLAM
jgi:hypothetical protein